MAVPAGIALLDMINTPIVLMTHSQGGGVGFEVTEQRPKLIHAMVAIEPGGPQFGGVNTSTAEAGPRNPRSWGSWPPRVGYARSRWPICVGPSP